MDSGTALLKVMFYLVLFFSILATIFTLSRETRQLLNDYTRESNIIDYIVIFIIYFIVVFQLRKSSIKKPFFIFIINQMYISLLRNIFFKYIQA